jgi:hypothetical protein
LVAQYGAYWICNVTGVQSSSRNLVKQWLEKMVIAAINNRDCHSRTT